MPPHTVSSLLVVATVSASVALRVYSNTRYQVHDTWTPPKFLNERGRSGDEETGTTDEDMMKPMCTCNREWHHEEQQQNFDLQNMVQRQLSLPVSITLLREIYA